LEKKLGKLDSKTGKKTDETTTDGDTVSKGKGTSENTNVNTQTQQGMSSSAKIGLTIGGVVVLGLIIVLATRRN
jgi:hypothetical protein